MGVLEDLLLRTNPAAAFPAVPPEFDEAAMAEAARVAAAERLRRGVRHDAPFAAPAVPFGALGAGMGFGAPAPSVAPDEALTPAASPIEGTVPLPRPRPKEADGSAAGEDPGALPPNATPTSHIPDTVGPPVPRAQAADPVAAPEQPSTFGSLASSIMGGLKNNSATLLAIGAGMAGAPNIGQGISRASAAAIPASQADRKNVLTLQSQQQTLKALLDAKVPANVALASLNSPEVMKATVAKYFETKPAQVVNDRLVREGPDGTVKLLADYSDDKKAPAGYQWKDGKLEFIAGGPADPKVKRELGERQNAPPGYRWVDPADPAKGMVAIPGGPGEKVDAQVAARLGLAQSFLDQLPQIRDAVKKGKGTGPFDAAMAYMGLSEQGELRRRIESGTEALLRNLTGAGMNQTEAAEYARRYKLQPQDTVSSVLSKMDQLERELQYTMEAVGKGRGGTPEKYRTPKALGAGESTEIDGVTIRRVK